MSVKDILNYKSWSDYIYMDNQLDTCREEMERIILEGYSFQTTRLDIRLREDIDHNDASMNNPLFMDNILYKIRNNLRRTYFGRIIYSVLGVIELSHKNKGKWHTHLQVFWIPDVDCDIEGIRLKEYIEYLALSEEEKRDVDSISPVSVYVNFDSEVGIGIVDLDNYFARNQVLLCLRYLCKYRITPRRAKIIHKRGMEKGYLDNNDLFGTGKKGVTNLFRKSISPFVYEENDNLVKLPLIKNKSISESSDKAMVALRKIRINKGIKEKGRCRFFESLKIDNRDISNYVYGIEKDRYPLNIEYLERLGIEKEYYTSIEKILKECTSDGILNRLGGYISNGFLEAIKEEENISIKEWGGYGTEWIFVEDLDTRRITNQCEYYRLVNIGLESCLVERVFFYISIGEDGKYYIDLSKILLYKKNREDKGTEIFKYLFYIKPEEMNRMYRKLLHDYG